MIFDCILYTLGTVFWDSWVLLRSSIVSEPLYCPVEVEMQCLHLTSVHTQGQGCLGTAECRWELRPPSEYTDTADTTLIHWRLPGCWGASLLPHVAPIDTSEWGEDSYLWKVVKVLAPHSTFSNARPMRGGDSVPCNSWWKSSSPTYVLLTEVGMKP